MTTKKKPSWSSDWVKKQSWNKIPMLMTMTSTPYPLAEKILMRRLLKKVLKILKVLKVPDWDTWKYWRYQIEWHWTCRQLARIVQSSLDSFESWRCPNSYQSTDILDKRLDSYEVTFWWSKICRATAIPSDRALQLSCTMVCILGFCIHQTYSRLKLSLLADWNVWCCK